KSVIPSDYKEPILFRIFDSKLSVVVCVIMIPIVLFSTLGMGTMKFYPPEEEEETTPFDPVDYVEIDGPSFDSSGLLQEGESTTETITINPGEGELLEEGELLKSITFVLTWEDEADYQPAPIGQPWPNQPDEFNLKVSQGGNYTERESGANPHGGQGEIIITFEFVHDSADSRNGTGDWEIEITLTICGDHESPTLPLLYTDDSNDYELKVTTEVYTPT
ncbi:MAG: hypothetical protein JSW28_10115, partial [Thermoplasmata archaeon]